MKPVSYRLPSDSVPGLPDPALRSPGVLPGSHIEGMPLADLPLQPSPLLIIDYTYDALHRLTSAAYSDGRNFGYTYDAAGNVLELEQNLGPGTVITTYTYDAANQLDTAQQGSHFVGNNTSQRKSYTGVNTGPVKISSTNGVPVIPSERVIYKVNGVDTSYSEMMGLPDSQLDTTYWFPWYNNIGLDTQLRFANTTNTPATVHVYIGGTEMTGGPFTLAPGESMLKSFPSIDAGPVKIASNVPIVASERMIYKVNNVYTSFSEMMGLPDGQLDTMYWFPWYNNVDLDTQLRFANVSGSTATVRVYIGGTEMAGGPFTLAAGASLRQSFAGINAGPVKVISNVPIVSSERVIYSVSGVQTSYSEMLGLPDDQLDTTFWFPSYNNVELDTQLRVANVSASTATVRIYVGGVEMTSGCTPSNSPVLLAAGASIRFHCSGVNNGPVKIVSNTNIVAAARLIYKANGVNTSFSEIMGLPDSLLDTTYWAPWYNKVDLNTELILGVGGSTGSGGEGFTDMSSQSSAEIGVDSAFESESIIELDPIVELDSTIDPFDITVEDGSPFWQGLTPGASQDSVVTFTNIHTPVGEQHSNGVWTGDSIQVLYDTPNQRIQVWTYSVEDGWAQRGEDIPVTFADGDMFRTRALTDGTVEIYQNGSLLTQGDVSPLSQPVLNETLTPEPVSLNQPVLAEVKPVSYQLPSDSVPDLPTDILSSIDGLPLPALPLQQSSPLTIDYTYDALNHLTSAAYSDGRSFAYTYDAAGNVVELEKNLGPGTVVTTYTYDIASQLETAVENGVTWQYDYDANGSLISDGVKTYTYDSANRLVTVNGPSSTVQMSYNGLGQRLSMDAAGVIAHYVMDGDQLLTASSTGNTTFYLYGLGAIAEKTDAWSYSLPDGTNTPRQLSNPTGEITLSARYTPWGDTLDTYGTGGFTFGYFGGVMDAATGLLYVGNGQYYDPQTGRFLTRDARLNQPNPYVPWDPTGAIVGPLGVIALFFTKKKKGSKWGTLFVVLLVVGSLGMTLAACGPSNPSTTPPALPPTSTPIPGSGTNTGGVIATPEPSSTPPAVPCPTPSAPTSTSTPQSYIQPWKKYSGYDPASNSIPTERWGGLDSNSWDAERSELVWSWLGEAQGKWWRGKYPDAQELTTWLLWQESGSLFSEALGDNVYRDGGGMVGAKLMIRFMKRLFSDGIDKLDLARFTAFYNPNSGGSFDQGDWGELMTAPNFYPYGNTVNDFWGLDPLNEELTWWTPGEPGFNYDPLVTVRHPNGSGDILYFAYK